MSSAISLVAAVIGVLAAVGLYAALWRKTKGLSLSGKLLVRLALPLLVSFPFVALLMLGSVSNELPMTAGAPPPAEMEGGSGLRKKKAAKPPSEDRAVDAATDAQPEPEPAEALVEPSDGRTATGEGVTRGIEPPAPPPPPAAAPAPSAPAPGGAVADAGAPPAVSETEPYSVVPVFFGTDRARNTAAARLDYGLERARTLELGRALVSVPKAHEVPQIERPWSISIPYFDVKIYEETEDPAKHFTMREVRSLTRQEMLDLVRERLKASSRFKDHAFVFVHGFNTTFDHAVFRTAQIANDLKFDGAPFLYSWPSGGGVASYTYDRESAGQSEPFMRDFMNLVVAESGAKAVSVIAHSMGNQPVLQVLKDMKRARPDVIINQIILAAPDVDRDNFENIAKEIQGLAKGITLYVAANDRALSVSRRFHGGVPRAGDVPVGGPLILQGVDTIDVTGVSTDSLGINHSGYAESNALLNDISLLIQTGERPPEKRIPILARVTTPKGDYWRYPPP